MKIKTMIAAGLAAATLGATTFAGVAGADGTNPETSGTGWDDLPDVIIGGGSDTTYAWHQLVERIYNQAAGCRVITSSSNPDRGKCLTGAAQDQTDNKGNWDHDTTASSFPTGSSSGVKALLAPSGGNSQLNPPIDYGRSSREPKSSGETGLNFWGVAKEALAIVTFGTRASANLTATEVQEIFTCQKTDWSQVGGGAYGSGPIQAVGMNDASGTYGAFTDLANGGNDPNSQPCMIGYTSGEFPFENDTKQIDDLIADGGKRVDGNPIPGGVNRDNMIWWMSSAAWQAYSYKRGDAKINTVDNQSPTDIFAVALDFYPYARNIFHVTRTADATPDGGTDNVLGATGGTGGAVREFTEFLCKTEANHTLNEFTGRSNFAELQDALSETGYLAVPAPQATNGVCRVIAAP